MAWDQFNTEVNSHVVTDLQYLLAKLLLLRYAFGKFLCKSDDRYVRVIPYEYFQGIDTVITPFRTYLVDHMQNVWTPLGAFWCEWKHVTRLHQLAITSKCSEVLTNFRTSWGFLIDFEGSVVNDHFLWVFCVFRHDYIVLQMGKNVNLILLDVVVELLGVAVLAEFGQGFGFYLADAFAGDGEFLADLFERVTLAVL